GRCPRFRTGVLQPAAPPVRRPCRPNAHASGACCRAWPCRRNRSHGIPAAAILPAEWARPVAGRRRRQLHTCSVSLGVLLWANPVGDGELARARQGQLVVRRRPCNGGAGADGGTRADFDRRHQLYIGADEGMVAKFGDMLARPVIIAGDDTGADLYVPADTSITDITQMIDLAARTQRDFLRFHEIADAAAIVDAGRWAQTRKRSHA